MTGILIERALEREFLRLGAKRVEVTLDGVATHWLTLAEADKAREKFDMMSFASFGRAPERIEVFRDKGLFACFVKWAQAPEKPVGHLRRN